MVEGKNPPIHAVHLNDGRSQNKRGPRGIENLAYVARGIQDALNAVRPNLVMLENYAGGRGPNPSILAQTGEVTGQAKLLMYYMEIPWLEVAASTLKKYVTGHGNSPKSAMLEASFRKFGAGSDVIGTNDNIVDAYCLARMGIAKLLTERGEYEPPKYEQECFAKVRIGGSAPSPKKRR